MSSFFFDSFYRCSHLNCHCLLHFGYTYYLLHGNLPQHPPVPLLNKSSSSPGQRSSANEVSMDMHEHEEFVGGGRA